MPATLHGACQTEKMAEIRHSIYFKLRLTQTFDAMNWHFTPTFGMHAFEDGF
jgi:hypothetical protein